MEDVKVKTRTGALCELARSGEGSEVLKLTIISDLHIVVHHPVVDDDRVHRLSPDSRRAEYRGGQVKRGEARH